MNESTSLYIPHILVVDDDIRLRQLLQNWLKKQAFIVSAVANTTQARELISLFRFDLLIVDIMMPGEDGFSLLKSIRADHKVPVILLTALSETDYRLQGLELGADDYMNKPFEPKELTLRIHNILRRVGQIVTAPKPRIFELGAYEFLPQESRLLKKTGEAIHLTGAEMFLLKELAQSYGQAVSRLDLARRCRIKGGERAVDVQVARLRSKLEDDPKRPQFITTIRGQGYALRPQQSSE